MTAVDRAGLTARDTILKMLSDEETAKVSTAEGASLAAGDEYADLEQLDAGVQTAKGAISKAVTGHIVPRSAVHAETWSKIVALLGR